MKISLGYLLSFSIGIGTILLINFFLNERNSSVKTNSGIYPMIYRSIDDQEASINSISADLNAINLYKKQLGSSESELLKISLPKQKIAENEELLSETRKLREQVQRAYDPTVIDYRNISNRRASVDTALYAIATDIGNNFYWIFGAVWDSSLNNNAETLLQTPNGQNYLNTLRALLDSNTLQMKKNQMIAFIKNQSDRLDQLMTKTEADKETIRKKITGLQDSLKDIEQSSKDRMLMYVVIPLFGLIVVLLMVLPYIYKQNTDILSKLFEQKVILQIFTVFILVMTILLLGIGDKIKAETLGTLLGGISVYVLQKTMDGTGEKRNDE